MLLIGGGADDLIFLIHEHDLRSIAVPDLLRRQLRVRHQDDLITDADTARCGAVQADHAAAALTGDGIGLKAVAVLNIHDGNLLVFVNAGRIQQIGTPEDIYNEPKNAFVADFIGDSNIVDGIMEKDFLVSFGGQEFACVDRGFKPREPVQVVVRPEDVDIVPPSAGKLTGLVREVIFKGVHFEMHVDVEGKEWLIHSTQASQPGELIGMNIGPDEIHIMSREEV